MLEDLSTFDHTRRIVIVHPDVVMTLTTLFHASGDVTVQEANLMANAYHFGFPVLWGVVTHDPTTGVWNELVPRPVVPCFHAIHVAEA